MDEVQLTNEELAKKIEKETNDIINLDEVKELIKNNIIEFTHKDVKYRIIKPTFEDKQKTNRCRQIKYIELLKDPTNLLEKDLVEIYKTRGINIQEMDIKFNNLTKERNDLSYKLGKAISENKSTEELQIYKKEIEKIVQEQQRIMIEKSLLLDSSIESQINVFVYLYLTALITEKCISETGNWIKAWPQYEDLIKEDESIVNKAVYYTTLIARNDLQMV